MEHILQFGVSIDDEAIVKSIIKNADKQIIEDLNKEVKKSFFETERDWYGKENIKDVQDWVKVRLDAFLAEHKDDIIKIASDKLADKLSRSKYVKEAIADKVKEK